MSALAVPETDLSLVTPYRGPTPLRQGDPIFGRDREIRLLLDQLLSDRLVLVHSLSGCGKTSLMEAGIVPKLPKSFSTFPRILVKPPKGSSSNSNPLLARVRDALQIGRNNTRSDSANADDLGAILDQRPRDVSVRFSFLFFDQFEEALATKEITEATRIDFFKQIGLLLERSDVWAAFAIREDYLGNLQPYLRYLPTQLSSRFRLTQLSIDNAASAIQMRTNDKGKVHVNFTNEAASWLANDLARRTAEDVGVSVVEPVYLQVVCDYLWRNTSRRPIDIGDFGEIKSRRTSVATALGDYYSGVVHTVSGSDEDLEFKIRTWFDKELIDKQSEQRNRVRVVWASAEISKDQLRALEDKYLIREDPHSGATGVDVDRVVELAHDRLIIPVIQNNEGWFRRFNQCWLESAAEWAKSPASHLLLRGSELTFALRWAKKNEGKLDQLHRNFLKASVERRRTQRLILTLSLMVVVVAIGTFLFSIRRSKVVIADAEIQKARILASAAQARAEADAAQTDAIRVAAENASLSKQLVIRDRQLEIRDKQLEIKDKQLATKEKNWEDRLAVETASAAKMTLEAKKDAAIATQNANAEVAKIYSEAKNVEARARTLEAFGNAKDNRDLSQAIQALRNALDVGDASLLEKDGHPSLLASALALNSKLLSRGLLESTIDLPGYVQSLNFVSANDSLTVVAEDGSVYEFARDAMLQGSKESAPVEKDPMVRYPTASVIARDNDVIALGTWSGMVELRRHGSVIADVDALHHKIVALTFAPDGSYFGASSALWSVSAWRLQESRAIRVFHWPGSPWSPAAWLRWMFIFKGKKNQLANTVSIRIDDQDSHHLRRGVIAVGEEDGCVKLVPLNAKRFHSTKPLLTVACGDRGSMVHPVVTMAFGLDGKWLATGTRDGLVELWDLSGSPAHWHEAAEVKRISQSRIELVPEAGDQCKGSVTSIAFSPNQGAMLAVGCQDGQIRIYGVGDLKPGATGVLKPLETLEGKLGEVRVLAFDPTVRQLYSGGERSAIEVWRIPNAKGFADRKVVRSELESLQNEAHEKSRIAAMRDRILPVIAQVEASSKASQASTAW